MQYKELLYKLLADCDLSRKEMEGCIAKIIQGEFPDSVIAAFLVLLQKKGITAEEVIGAYSSLISRVLPVHLDENAVDTCGTGGDQAGTFNLSTAAAIIANGTGVRIAKHGNRSVTSHCGSADVLETLGYNIDLPPKGTEELFHETGFAFLFAPLYHPSMKAVAHVRKELGIKTIFNMLGPLVNPARANRQVVGVFDMDIMDIYVQTLKATGCRHALVVHGETETGAGLDEPSVCGPTRITELHEGEIFYHEVLPETFGLSRWNIADLKGGDKKHNAEIILKILDGSATEAQTEAALYSAAMACYVSGTASCIDDGLMKTRNCLESGKAAAQFSRILSLNSEIADKYRTSHK
ncbi:anthranilate phosphoribosyltransferase [Prosthecochloris marina]|uniref:Anthranilate phosphoribosyltransferase n=1 Tax=Prosthecochloris marina TaxID=2017681 RepID=A0A317T8G0_9CHLB|nr:anthranilate phosphoribosyltransferase [Prosthecochloris marina]PWW81706.1 anthranilate phosphoribosyltransferase [Prosthecochloris marina]